jgi:DNA-binding Lrp family transcriptional regulator
VARLPRFEASETVDLDEVDLKLIDLLKIDGRLSNRAMTSVLGLKEAAVAARLKSLTERNLLAVSTIFDWQRAGYSWDMWLYIKIEGRAITAVAEDIARFDNVASVQVLFGGTDLIVHVLSIDRQAALHFLTSELATIPGIHHVRSAVSLDTVKFDIKFATLPLEPRPLVFPNPVVEVDDFDITMLEAFQLSGRRSIRHVARELGVSDSTIRLRLARLDEAGLVQMCAQVDPARTRLLRAWAYIGVNTSGVDKTDVAAAIAEIPQTIVVSHTTGDFDMIVLAAAARRATLLSVILEQIRAIPGVDSTETSEIIRTTKMDFRWAKL